MIDYEDIDEEEARKLFRKEEARIEAQILDERIRKADEKEKRGLNGKP